jgi:hypothetical protein
MIRIAERIKSSCQVTHASGAQEANEALRQKPPYVVDSHEFDAMTIWRRDLKVNAGLLGTTAGR